MPYPGLDNLPGEKTRPALDFLHELASPKTVAIMASELKARMRNLVVRFEPDGADLWQQRLLLRLQERAGGAAGRSVRLAGVGGRRGRSGRPGRGYRHQEMMVAAIRVVDREVLGGVQGRRWRIAPGDAVGKETELVCTSFTQEAIGS